MPATPCSPPLRLDLHPKLPIEVTANAPQISSDGGLLLLRQADERLRLCERIAELLPDDRDPLRIEHSRLEQLRQRVYQIALGYLDCNDAGSLRNDPLFKTACDRLPGSSGLSSQPTLSRWENTATGHTINQIRHLLEQLYVDELPENTEQVVLDIDSTDDETHGQQQLSFFHGYYDQHMYHPLLVYDGLNGQLATVLLRPGNAHSARSAKSLLVPLIRRIKKRFPHAQILVRGDSGFCVPRVLDALEALDRELGEIHYLLGLAKNSRLQKLAEPAMCQAAEQHQETGQAVRRFTSFPYQADSWPHPRHVIAKAEHLPKGPNPRFVVTTLEGFPPELIYEGGYCPRGQCENLIKNFKNGLGADRLSCERFVPNFFRLLLHAIAYRLLHAIQRVALEVAPQVATMQFDTLRLRLLKVAANVKQTVRRVLICLPKSFGLWPVFQALMWALGAPAPS